jgi:ATP-dependent DNA helicase RecG
MEKINLKVLLEKGENRLVKIRNCFNYETIITLSAFANSSGGKIIIDSGNYPDTESVDGMIDEWLNTIIKSTVPELSIDVHTEKIGINTYILLSVDESVNKPISCDEKYYFRREDTDKRMDLNEIINMLNSF